MTQPHPKPSPLAITITQDNTIDRAKSFCHDRFPDNPEIRHTRLGLLVDFIDELFASPQPPNNNQP